MFEYLFLPGAAPQEINVHPFKLLFFLIYLIEILQNPKERRKKATSQNAENIVLWLAVNIEFEAYMWPSIITS